MTLKNESLEKRVQWIYKSKNNQDLAERYDVWASEYEQDLEEGFGYIGPQRVVDVLANYLPQDAKILDAGAGTGLVGLHLHSRGYSNVEGMDISSGMLAKAAEKNVYSALSQEVMGEPLGFASDAFDGVVSVGVLTYGHAPSHSFDELIRITRPGGFIVFPLVVDFYESSDFAQKMKDLEEAGQWKLISLGEAFQPLPKLEPDIYYQIWVYEVISDEHHSTQ